MQDLLPVIKAQADLYQSWTRAAADATKQLDIVEKAVYRMQASGTEVLKPLIIWLHEPGRDLPVATINSVVRDAESWTIRRMLLRLTGSDLGRIVAGMINDHRDVPAEELAERISGYLSRLSVTSTYWPGDLEIREALRTEAIYQRWRRPRLRVVLEAIEDHYRASTGESQVERKGYPIEHVLPQSWQDHWSVDGLAEQQDRAEHVHWLGNLTLLTKSLNPKVSNGAWQSKRKSFLNHNTIKLTGRLVSDDELQWDEAAIDDRTEDLIDVVLGIWPVPAGHLGNVADPQSKTNGWVEIKHLVAAGLLQVGDELIPRSGEYQNHPAVILDDFKIQVDDHRFTTPSGAAKKVRGGSTNGWKFWRLADGRRLEEVRDSFLGDRVAPRKSAEWAPLHTILETLPEGRWTTYGDLADAVGTSARTVGHHVAGCDQCSNAHRILRKDGTVSPDFSWSDRTDHRDPVVVLESEGLAFVEGRADPTNHLSSEELVGLSGSDGLN